MRIASRQSRFFYGWVIVAVMATVGFSQSSYTFNVLGVFLKPVTEEFGWSRGVFAGAVGIGTLLGGAVALFVGPLIDRFGSRWVLAVALWVSGGVFLGMAVLGAAWQLYALQVAGRLLNVGVLGIVVGVVIPKWFVTKRGRAVAFSSLGVNAGAVILPLGAQFLTDAWSWRVAAAGVGLMIWIVSLVPVVLFMRRQPEDMGLLPDDSSTRPAPADTATADRPRRDEYSFRMKEASRTSAFYLIALAMALAWLIRTSIALHVIAYLTDKGLSSGIAVTVVAVQAGVGILGVIGSGFLAERLPPRLVLTAEFVIVAACLLWLIAVDSTAMALAWAVAWGLFQGGFVSLQPVILANYFGRRHLGSIQAPARSFQTLAQAAGPLIAATAYDRTGGYLPAFAAYIAVALLAALFVFLARPPRRPRQGAGVHAE